MPKKGEEYESFQATIYVDDETGNPYWEGGGPDDKGPTTLDEKSPIVLDPTMYPPGTRIHIIEPWDEEFYYRQLDEYMKRCYPNLFPPSPEKGE